MGKKFFQALSVVALVASFFVPGAIFLGFAGSTSYLAISFATILQGVAAISATVGFSPELPNFRAARQFAENLTIQANPLGVRDVVFGKSGIAGQILFRQNVSGAVGEPDELLLILRLTGYPATSLTRFWLNGHLVFDGETTGPGPGAITTGEFADELWVYFRTGEETGEAFPEIGSISTAWGNNLRIIRGCACVAIRVMVTEKLEGRIEPLAEIKGAKLYDPRLDSTVPGGSGTHDFDDPATWAWSDNPKLAEILYIRGGYVNGVRIFGMAKPKAAINLENYASEANICDEQIPVKAGGTINRYTCNGRLIPSEDHRANLQKLLSASAGTSDASTGVYHTYAGAWRSPADTLTEADIDGVPSKVRMQIDPAEEVNIITGVFADPFDRWQPKGYPGLRDLASIDQVGENAITLDLPFTVDHRMAQRLAKIEMKRRNAAKAFHANYWLNALPFQPGDILTQQYARYQIDHTFRVNLWGLQGVDDRQGKRRLIVPMQLIEERQEWFDWDPATEEKDTPTLVELPTMDRRPKMTTLDGVPTFVGPLPPGNPKVGWLWRDTDTNVLFRWSGSAWVDYATETKTADQIDYLSGASVESLEPAEAAADVTSLHAINGVDNPEFEAGDVSWFQPNVPPLAPHWFIVNDPANARVGNWCVQFLDEANGNRFINIAHMQVQPGDRVQAHAFFKITSGPGGGKAVILWQTAVGGQNGEHDGNVVTSTSYAKSEILAANAPANTFRAVLALEIEAPLGTETSGFADGTFMAIIAKNSISIGSTGATTAAGARTNLGAVGTSRTLTAGSGLSGGGSLAADRSFAVDGTVIRTTGNQSMSGRKTFTGAFCLNGVITPPAIAADGSTTQNYAPSGHATANVIQISTDPGGAAAGELGGLAGGTDGRVVVLQNVGPKALIVFHQNAGSTAANRFDFGPDPSKTLAVPGASGSNGGSLTVWYNGATNRWVPLCEVGVS